MVSSSGSSSGSRRETAGNFWSPLRSHSSAGLAGWEQEHNDHKRSTMSRKNNEGPVLSGPVISSLQLHSPRYHQHWAGQVRGHGPLAPVYTQGGWPYCPYKLYNRRLLAAPCTYELKRTPEATNQCNNKSAWFHVHSWTRVWSMFTFTAPAPTNSWPCTIDIIIVTLPRY